MGASQSRKQEEKSKRIKQEEYKNNLNGSIRHRDIQSQPRNTKKNPKRLESQPIQSDEREIQPIKNSHASKPSIAARETERNVRKVKQSKQKESKNTKSGNFPHKKTTSKKNNETSTEKETKLKTRSRPSHRKRKEQIEKEMKKQRVSKEQLRSLASSLKRTSWYLGLRLGMDNSQARRYDTSFATEEERKYQILLWWRRVKGWKATIQQLVILLELGQYTEEEYTSILTSSNGDVAIYDKAPDLLPETVSPNGQRELYHSETTKPPVRSFGNMSYDDTVKAHLHEAQHKKRSSHIPKEERNKDVNQKRKSRQIASEPQYNTLPPRFKDPTESQKNQRRSESKDTVDKHATKYNAVSTSRRKHTRSKTVKTELLPDPDIAEEAIYAEISKVVHREVDVAQGRIDIQTVPDESHSITSHTDDSGIVTSPLLPPRQPEASQSAAGAHQKQPKCLKVETEKGTTTKQKKQSSKTLIVRRCSDSVVKLRHTSLLDNNSHGVKFKESVINEESPERLEQLPSNKVGYSANYEEINGDGKICNGDMTHHRSTAETVGDVTDDDEITESMDDGVTDNEGIRRSTGDVMNSNCDLTKIGYRNDIQGMIKKYETLTKINEKKKRESMAESIARHYERTTLPRDFAHGEHSTHYASYSSLNSYESHRSSQENKRHRRHSRHVRRYHYFTFGGKGRFPSRFKGLISGLALFPNGRIIASDGDNKRIQIFDLRGRFKTTFDTNTDLKPKGVCITPDDKIAVCCGDSVNVFDTDGNLHLSFGQGIFRNNSYAVCCDKNGNYYVTDIVSHTISIHDSKGKIRKRFGFEGTSMIHFNQPVSVAISRKNQLFITDSQNHCIKVYTLSGKPLFRIGTKGSADGLLWSPLGICLDENDQLYVADCGNNRISQFDSDGNFVQNLLTEEDGLWMPSLVQMNKHGQLVICEWEKQLIKVFTIETSV